MTARQLARSSIERAKPAKLFYNVRRSDQRQRSKTAGGWLPLALLGLGRFSKNGAGRTGFEPVTSSVSECRSDAFGQLDRACDLPSYSVVPPAGPQRFPCIYPAYPGRPRATVGPTSALFSNTRSSRWMGRVRGDRSRLSAHRAASAHRLKSRVTLCALRNTDAGHGWLRVRIGNPACYLCAVWVPGAVGKWRWLDVGHRTDGSARTVEHPNLK
jgi:hypothetical protein